ncbi:MAG: YggS family pyridoxal phosphate-dependent enzyme, partial [Clostridia bacterium]|nr:YggS family pyridoxal phosphate-dependent enzyme [Clostridia bacterium]
MTDEYKNILAENFARLEENIKKYAKDGKKPLVVAATKTVDAKTISYAAENFGLTDIGENRVQELLAKYDELDKDRLNIHFIGHLQKNKVKYIVGKVCLIHSL